MVTRAKEEGGLGVLDLKTQNEALLIKNLHKFFNKLDIPWVKLVWERYYNNGKLPSHIKKDLSGRKISSNFWTNTKVWHWFPLRMGLHACFGMIFGLDKCQNMLILNFIHSLKVQT